MKKVLLLLLVIIAGPLLADEMHVQDLSGGMWSYPSANKIPDNGASYIQNFYTDIEPMATERNGYVKRDATLLGGTKSVPGLWSFTDSSGQDWTISFSSRTFYKNTIGGTPTAFGLSATSDQVPNAAVNLGKIWFTNGSDPVWSFDGTSTATVSGAPLGKLITSWRNRIVIANISGALSTVRVSKDGDGTNWTIGSNPSDPFSFQIGGANDGQYIRCIWGLYQDNMVISRKYDTYIVSGFSQADYQIRSISSEVGCIEPGTQKEFDGSLIWLSARGLEDMQGTTIHNVSDPVRDLTDVLIRNSINQRFNTQTSQSDWGAGSISVDLSSTVSSGDLQAKTTTWTLTTQADWIAGTVQTSSQTAYIDTTTVSGDIQLTFPDSFNTFRDGTSGTKNVWTSFYVGSGSGSSGVSGGKLQLTHAGSTLGRQWVRTTEPMQDFQQGTTYHIRIESIPTDPLSPVRFYITLSSIATITSHADSLTSFWTLAFTSSNTNRVSIGAVCSNDKGDSICYSSAEIPVPLTFDLYLATTTFAYTINGSSTIKTGTHTWPNRQVYVYYGFLKGSTGSGILNLDDSGLAPEEVTHIEKLDTGIINPLWGVFTATGSVNDGTLKFFSSVSSDDSTYDSDVALTTNSIITSSQKRYLKIKADFKVNYATNTSPTLQAYNANAGSSGTYTSQLLSIGSLISSWGAVTISDVKNSGTISYEFGSTNTASVGAITNWASIVNGGVPTVSTNPYAAFRMTKLQVNTGTDTAKISDFTTSWNEGAAPPLVAGVYDKRYWLSFTTTTASNPLLDTVLVYQRNRTFTLFKGINAASFSLWRDSFYFGNSNTTGLVYKFDVGNNDDGSAIVSEIRFKAYDLGAFRQDKDFRQSYISYLGDSGYSGSFELQYEMDRSKTFNSLGSTNMADGTGQINAKFPFAIGTSPVQGREIRFRVVKNGTGDRLRLYDILTDYTTMEAR